MRQTKTLLLILITCFYAGCKNPQDQTKEKAQASLTQFYLEKAKEFEFTLDSLIVIDVDSLTPKQDSLWKLSNLQSSAEALIKERDLQGQRTILIAKQVRVFNEGLGGAPQYLKDNLAEEKEKFEAMGVKFDKLIAQIDKLSEVVFSGSVDSISHNGYVANFRVIGHDKANVAMLDTQSVRLNKDFRILQNTN